MVDSKDAIYEFDNFRLEAAERLLTRDGVPIVLSSKAFDLLLTLVENSGHLVEKETLYSRVWADSIVEDSNLTVQMSAIRKALGANDYIKTIKGHGYRFNVKVHKLKDVVEEVEIEKQIVQRITIENETRFDANDGVVAGNVGLDTLIPKYALVRAPGLPSNRKRRIIVPLAITVFGLAAISVIGMYVWRSGAFANGNSVVASFQSGTIKRLTSTGKIAYASAISPDGKLFAYSQFEGELQGLWLGHIGGGEPLQIRPPAEVSYVSVRFSPDGASLYYSTAEGGLFRMPVFGGAPEKINENVRRPISFAPDAKRFAFVRNKGAGEPAIVIATADGREENAIGIPPTKLGFVSNSPAWSPDGSVIAVAASLNENGTAYDAFEVNVNDGSVRQITSNNFTGIDWLLWLGEDREMVAVSSGSLWHIKNSNGDTRRLLNDLSLYGPSMSLAISGNELLTVQTQQHSNIWVASADNVGQAKQVTFGSLGRADGWSGLDWTTDGKIIYTAVVDSKHTIWSMNADGSGQTQLTPSGQRNFHPSVADDGRTIVFTSLQGGKYAIWRMNIDGGEMRQLTDIDIAAQPHISPDGKWIVYISDRDGFGTLHRIPAGGGEPVRLADKEMCWVRVSPDSRYIAGGYRDGEKTHLAILTIDGGAPIKTFDVPRQANFRLGVRWSPDGKSIAYRDWANGIWKQDIEGGVPARIDGLPEEKLYSFGWSRDGTQFAFVRGQEIRDVVLIRSSKS